MNQKEVTLSDILQCLKEQKEEIQEAKRETHDKIGQFMKTMESNVREVKKDVNVLNELMEERERANKDTIRTMNERYMETEKIRREDNLEINRKLKLLEVSMTRKKEERPKQKTLQQKKPMEMEEWQSQPAGRSTDENQLWRTTNTGHRTEPVQDLNQDTHHRGTGQTFSQDNSDWQKSVQEELKEAADKANKIEQAKMEEAKKKRKAKGGMKGLKKWFAQESPETSEVSEDSDSSENETEIEIINRRERNKIRKRRNNDNKKRLKAEVALKASHTLGCQPIKKEDVEAMMIKTGDIKEARKLAVLKYLRDFLQYNDEELKQVDILDTKISPKGDHTVYAVFKNLETVKEIHWRLGEIRNPAIIVRNYVPPQYWARYMHLNRECTAYRAENANMKTQLRFGEHDVEILLKQKGTGESYKKVPYETITDPRYVPKFDYNFKWTQSSNTAPRRKLTVYKEATIAMETETESSKITRQSSLDLRRNNEKKNKFSTASTDSSSGTDGSEEEESL